jgi:uncharacterized protein
MRTDIDYYALLELPPTASSEEVEAAYQRLMRAWHPANYRPEAPRGVRDLAAERTKQLIEAREVLLDRERRRAYDEQRTQGRAASPARPEAPGSELTLPVPGDWPVAAAAGDRADAPHVRAEPAEGSAAGAVADDRAAAQQPRLGGGRLLAWSTLAGLLALLGFALGGAGYRPTGDEAYRYSTAIAGIVFTALMLALLLWITPGIRVRDLLAFRRPTWPREVLALRAPPTWSWAFAAGAAIIVAAYAFSFLYDRLFGPFEAEQGIATFWDGSRAHQFALNFLVVAVLVPIEEELMYRGLGFALLERFGTWIAILGTGSLFALAHGIVALLPVFLFAGIALAWLRARTGSVYPGMLVHGAFNGSVVILAVVFG